MSKAKIVLACFVWLVVLSIGVFVYRLIYVPASQKMQAEAEQEVIDATSGNSNYKHRVKLGLDGFSGYAILRSDPLRQQLRSRSIKLELVDDGADYEARISAIESGELQMAAFPIDALLKVCESREVPPATIVGIIDETRGADAVVGYSAKFPNIDSLNDSQAKFVLVGDSPSETLVRVLMHNFVLDNLSNNSIDAVANESEVMARYRASTPAGNEVFVTWQPNVSELLKNDQLTVLFDTSSQSGYIVDALVVSRDFLVKNEPVVREVLKSYFTALYSFQTKQDLVSLVREDAKAGGAALSESQATSLVDGIVWKNTQENLAHFGLRQASLPHIEDMIDRIQTVLIETNGLKREPASGNLERFFFEKTLADLQTSGFHPGVSEEDVREDTVLQKLTDSQWSNLEVVGSVDVPPLVYARGTAKLTESSLQKLDDLIETLKSFPRYYVIVRGDASSRGDAEANRKLAKQRADAALQYLVERGMLANRARSEEGKITGKTSVSFVLGQLPY